MKKLISMVDFVLDTRTSKEEIIKYALFLNKALELSMFIPCDEDGNVLIDPETTMMQGDGQVYYGADDEDFKQYQQALDRVVFPNCNIETIKDYYLIRDEFNMPVWLSWNDGKTIEDLVHLNLEYKQ